MLKKWLIYITVLFGSIVFHGLYIGYVSYYILWAVISLPVFSLVISVYLMIKTKITLLPLPFSLRKDNNLEVSVLIESRKHLPAARIKLKYSIQNVTFEAQPYNGTVFIDGFHNTVFKIPVDTKRIGMINIKIDRIKIYDLLTLFWKPVKTTFDRSVLVTPYASVPKPMPVLPSGDILGLFLRPKPGGGFSEDYDLRSYRIGDPLRMIHWKLTYKRDDIIVKESLIAEKSNVVICINLFGDINVIERVFASLTYLNYIFTNKLQEYKIVFYNQKGELIEYIIMTNDDFIKFINDSFKTKIPLTGISSEKYKDNSSDWCYFLTPVNNKTIDSPNVGKTEVS